MYHKILITLSLLFSITIYAQEDLFDLLEDDEPKERNFVTATFKATKIISSNSVETIGEGSLNFVIQHRFGRITGGLNEFFGLDESNIRLALEYGLLDNVDIGFGRSSFERKLDFFVKYRFLRQSTGYKAFPFTIAAYASMQINTGPFPVPNRVNYFSSRLSYAYQIMIARKFGKWVSLQLTPSLVHKNLVASKEDRNDIFSLGIGASVRASKSVRINLEYYWTFENQIFSNFNQEKVVNAISIGTDIETGGHVFQINISNTRGMLERELIAETTGDILKGHLNLGFNISRSFALYDANKRKQNRQIQKSKNS